MATMQEWIESSYRPGPCEHVASIRYEGLQASRREGAYGASFTILEPQGEQIEQATLQRIPRDLGPVDVAIVLLDGEAALADGTRDAIQEALGAREVRLLQPHMDLNSAPAGGEMTLGWQEAPEV